MAKQIIFLATLLVTLGAFAYTTRRFVQFFKITKGDFPVKEIGRRFGVMMEVAIGQTKIFRRPVMGFLHALVFWGFLVILIGSIEMVIDGLSGTERVLSFLGVVYNIIMASGDIFALVIAIAILISGVVVTESVFVIPGLGLLTLDAIQGRDYPTVQALIILFSLVYILINLLIDVAYTLLDPRIRY